jgi:two-component system chemotaxis response regulator CheB
MSKVRVLIVEDSAVVRELLTHLINSDPRLEVAAAVDSAEAALRVLPRLRPAVISMDIRLPGMNGLEATQRIMAEHPTPIVVVAGSVHSEDLNIAMNALKAGALAVVEKPVGLAHSDFHAQAQLICTQLYIMSELPVIRQRGTPTPLLPRPSAPAPRAPAFIGPFRMLGVAASTGGPNALIQLLQGLGEGFPLPIAIVQHISPGFHAGFVNWLNGMVPQHVQVAEHGALPGPGHVYVAPPDRHLELRGERFHLSSEAPVRLQRPSATRLFETVASSLGRQAIGVILTGMGDDGADGMVAIRAAGGYTIAEHESTTVVYGMPAAAVARGAILEALPLGEIAQRVLALCGEPETRL